MKYVPDSSLQQGDADSFGNGLKLGIVRLGRAAGKVKYSLLDERDINLVQVYGFEARLEIDRNGNGAIIYAWCYELDRGRVSGQYVHNMLWNRYCGGIRPGWKITHLNNIPVDNRLENLALVEEEPDEEMQEVLKGPQRSEPGAGTRITEPANTIYWRAMQQLPIDSSENTNSSVVVRVPLDGNGDMGDDECIYYECRNPPCWRIERELREFSICGRCQTARYCGTFCQQRDWPAHKKFCRERKRYVLGERPPER